MSDALTILIVASAAVFGAAVGSFLNVCIYRLPRPGLDVHRPARSFCPGCGEAIRARDNIPILGWMLLGGRCRACRGPVSPRYLFVEALTALLFAVIVHRFLPDIAAERSSWVACVVLLAWTSALIVAAFVDFDLRIIPDEVTIGGMHVLPLLVLLVPSLHGYHVSDASIAILEPVASAAGRLGLAPNSSSIAATSVVAAAFVAFVVAAVAYRSYRRRFLPELPNRFRDVSLAGVLSAASVGWIASAAFDPSIVWNERGYAVGATLLGMLTGSALVFIVGWVGSKVFRKPAMGFGDVKLMGLLGGLAGASGAIGGFFIACLIGSIFGIGRLIIYRDRYLPFGPFLTIGCVAMVLWPGAFARLADWYLGLFRL